MPRIRDGRGAAVEVELAAGEHPVHAAIGPHDAVFAFEGLPRRHTALDFGVDGGKVVWVHALGERLVGAAERAGRQAPQCLDSTRPGNPSADHVPVEGPHVRRVECQPQALLAFAQGLGLPPHLELRHHLAAERRQPLRLCVPELARHAVRHGEAADDVTARRDERRAREEPGLRGAGHERIARAARVVGRVGDDQRLGPADQVRGGRAVAWRVVRRESDRRRVPLAHVVHERDERHRRLTDGGGELGEVAQRGVGRSKGGGVLTKDCEASVFIGGAGGKIHRQPDAESLGGSCRNPYTLSTI